MRLSGREKIAGFIEVNDGKACKTQGSQSRGNVMKRARFKNCDHRETLYSKGDVRRPEVRDRFSEGWEKVFGENKKDKSPEPESKK